jgi:hypothetical protein
MSGPVFGGINIRSICSITMAIFANLMLSEGIAHAQFLFWPRNTFWAGHYAPFKHKHHHRNTNSESARSARPEAPPKGPLQVIISIADQRVSLFDNGSLIARSSISTGIPGHPTPLGVFSVIGKQRWHHSNIYSAAPMPYMQRITWSGIALHAGVVPGHPASHGCIRLKNDFAVRLWHLTKRGTRVIIAHGDVQPVEIANPHLFEPKAMSASPEFQTATAAKSIGTGAAAYRSPVSNADTPEATSFQVPGSAPARGAPKKIVPISVFVSGKLSKLFVRQGFSPLFDVPVKIENPERPLGTHVFTAMEFQNEGAAIRWTVVSIPEEFPRIPGGATKEHETSAKQMALSVPLPEKASAALDRIEIPEDAVERISELLSPASSLIISDNGFSRETGKDTDFIVLTH